MKKVLYLGTDPHHFECDRKIVHLPLIQIIPCEEAKEAFQEMEKYTHLIFTSKNAVEIFFSFYKEKLINKIFVSVGKVTAKHLEAHGYTPQLVAREETQEGIIQLLKNENLSDAYLFLPRSSLSRPILVDFLRAAGVAFCAVTLYKTELLKPKVVPDLNEFEEIIFTSPSTVEAFFQLFQNIPMNVKLTPIGPITSKALNIHCLLTIGLPHYV